MAVVDWLGQGDRPMIGLVISCLATFSVMPLVRRLALRGGLLDVPNHRSSHVTPTPRVGGLACAAGVLVAVVGSRLMSHDVPWLALLGAGILASVGLIDDKWGLAPLPRLGLQVAVGGLLGAGAGAEWGWLGLGMVIAPVIVNVVNFMDGINGMTSLTIFGWGITAMIAGRANELMPLIVIGGVTAGSALGFLPWNAPVARIFAGDVGSYLFGGLVAGGVIYGWAHNVPPVLLIAPLWLYLTDTGVVILRRMMRGTSLLTPHREHVYQRLITEGALPHWVVALAVASGSAVVTVGWSAWTAVTGLAIGVAISALYLLSPSIVTRLTMARRKGQVLI